MSEIPLQATASKSMTHMKQDDFLNNLVNESLPTSIYLVNGIRLQGYLIGFDMHVIFFRSRTDETVLMIYKSAISTITIINEFKPTVSTIINKKEKLLA
jgi:host factor-I protein